MHVCVCVQFHSELSPFRGGVLSTGSFVTVVVVAVPVLGHTLWTEALTGRVFSCAAGRGDIQRCSAEEVAREPI